MILSLILFCGMGSSNLVAYTQAQLDAMTEHCEERPWENCREEIARLVASESPATTSDQGEDVSASTGSAGTGSAEDRFANSSGSEQSEPSIVPRLSQREARQVRDRSSQFPIGTFERAVLPPSESDGDDEANDEN